jgi:hypothetical protein
MSSPLTALRARIAGILTPERQTPGLPTGVEQLDALLPGGGLPIGRLTEVVAPRGGGRTTVLRSVVRNTVRTGGWVAVVDASRTLAPRDWEMPGASCFFIRPPRAKRGTWCADLLLRTGAFALVVLDGAPPLPRAVAARLTRLARDAGSALVLSAELPQGDGAGSSGATFLPGALRLRVERARPGRSRGERGRELQGPRALGERRRRVLMMIHDPEMEPRDLRPPHSGSHTPILITVEKGGSRRTVEVVHAAGVARRLCSHPEIPDRRGVARSGKTTTGRGSATAADAGAPHATTGHRSRTRRCAEPVYERERLASELPAPRERRAREHTSVG